MLKTHTPIAVLSSRESIGDCFMKLPLLRALKQAYPRHDVTWIVSEGASPFATVLAPLARPYIATVLGEARIERPVRDALARLRDLPPFSLVIDARSNVNRVALARFALRYEMFLTPTPGYLLSQRRPHLLQRQPHRGRRLLELLSTMTGRGDRFLDEIPLDASVLAEAERELPAGPAYVGLAPGASRPYKTWPVAGFVAVAEHLQRTGRVPVFLIGPDERALLPELRAAAPYALFPGCDGRDGHLTRAELTLALGRQLDAAVVNDTGVGHLLAAARVPLVSLFGPTDPRRWAPCGTELRLLRAQAFGGSEMRLIPVEAVLQALEALLARTASAAVRRALA